MMMAVVHGKKRDRLVVSSHHHLCRGMVEDSASAAEADEYEVASTFLREFHSRRVVASNAYSSFPPSTTSTASAVEVDPLHGNDSLPSSSNSNIPLESIIEDGDDDDDDDDDERTGEEDGRDGDGDGDIRLVVDGMLSVDFELVLGMGGHDAAYAPGRVASSPPRSWYMTGMMSPATTRMKRAITTECLLELGGGCVDDYDDDERHVPNTSTTCAMPAASPHYYSRGTTTTTTSDSNDDDDYFCHDLPSTKRSRGGRYLVY